MSVMKTHPAIDVVVVHLLSDLLSHGSNVSIGHIDCVFVGGGKGI